MNEVMTYKGGNNVSADDVRKLVGDNVSADGVRKLVGEAIYEECRGLKLWYTLKFDWRVLLQFASDEDVVNLMRGNDGDTYMHATDNRGLCDVSACELHESCSNGAGVRLHDGAVTVNARGRLKSYSVLGEK